MYVCMYVCNPDATYQLELLLLSCGDIHPKPGHIYQPRVPGNNNNNPLLQNRLSRAMKLPVFYANARSIVNKIAKLQMEIASNSFDIIVLTETHLYRRDRLQGGRFGGGVLIATNAASKFPQEKISFVNLNYCS